MIQAKLRPNNNRWIKKVLQKGRVWQGKLLRIKLLAYRQAGLRQIQNNPSRLSVVIAKKTAPLATRRNRIKRRVKAAAADQIKNLSGWDIVIFPRGEVLESDFKIIKEEITRCLNELR